MSENDIIINDLRTRVDKLEHIYDTISELTIEIKKLAIETKYMREAQNKLTERVDVLEHKPEKRFDAIISTIITTITGALVGALLMLILK